MCNRPSVPDGVTFMIFPYVFDYLQRIGLQVKNFDDFIFSLNNQGYLLKKGPQIYQLQTSSCL